MSHGDLRHGLEVAGSRSNYVSSSASGAGAPELARLVSATVEFVAVPDAVKLRKAGVYMECSHLRMILPRLARHTNSHIAETDFFGSACHAEAGLVACTGVSLEPRRIPQDRAGVRGIPRGRGRVAY